MPEISFQSKRVGYGMPLSHSMSVAWENRERPKTPSYRRAERVRPCHSVLSSYVTHVSWTGRSRIVRSSVLCMPWTQLDARVPGRLDRVGCDKTETGGRPGGRG